MTFSQWLFGGIDNPFKAGQWGVLHISVMLICIALILTFQFLAKRSHDGEKTKRIILCTLICCSAFFEVMLRFMYFMKVYYFGMPETMGLTALDILPPKPWCQISTWLLISSVFVNKTYFYNLASLSALLSAVVFFIYPGVGFNNEYLIFENWYSICTHALLLTTSITLIGFKYADFRYKHLWKEAAGFGLTFVYGLLQVFVLKIHADPMYFMPDGDIQAGILRMDYGVYIVAYIVLLVIYINVPHILGDKETVRRFLAKKKRKPLEQNASSGGNV